ncbi:prolipoprotein diacylglyceryl transferase [Wolinella succinogenes]|uniref:Phosphatidylglycerol--prolipoprotein diacylglyceryl transferase n=1 Tax=Wolinella succinogenes (strain ATCC 29543 / DSM 1740 / CCUG 13145 / JCM 31913 / LMG 7466 / NCTC 11488 / FDC 602W) TaxID=273121 RepID=LGT_WOLSU|nr:prolipoprotein diacylglyceryl transferase [Wolinella succinogenes]Q7M7S6.1 RecName: Full=Phosphatidylglycerol--prolipoprotein diacylglyceryl transferase [Wolinella succinogenes DSM 1740]CAE11109.1 PROLIPOPROTEIN DIACYLGLYCERYL TRANSFERASE EC 2.4.99 [Wolinella succinogenes]VEG81274.1 Prolipoprotein diacylglyceryl transferase [Wolinella succinogenes]HCZ19168.1 prolipoprotein diacylglyceryl transferase [Helicobacter sp.]
MEWNYLYNHFDPVAFDLWGLKVHWYGIAYVLALLVALWVAKWIAKKDAYPLSNEQLESYFIWVEVGVILGARLGYILFYDPFTAYYLTHPWQIFNPFQNGEFIGIRGMSYHGAVIGFLIASFLFAQRHGVKFWMLMDLVGISVPLGYVFGRIGNFLNQELIGRVTEVPWGIYVAGVLRHPSQLYEAFLEGIVLFVILYAWRSRVKFTGQLGIMYLILYALARFVAEFWREPDAQIGYLVGGVTMGQLLSLAMAIPCLVLWGYLAKKERGKIL